MPLELDHLKIDHDSQSLASLTLTLLRKAEDRSPLERAHLFSLGINLRIHCYAAKRTETSQMKNCPVCGKEYSDTSTCPVDAAVLERRDDPLLGQTLAAKSHRKVRAAGLGLSQSMLVEDCGD
jgi:hypothetical protein